MKADPVAARLYSPRPRSKTGKPRAICTIGYQGRTIGETMEVLLDARVSRLVDVRRNAISRKSGFSKRRLAEACAEAGLEYWHIPELGVPSALRADLRTRADYDKLFRHYARILLPVEFVSVQFAVSLVAEMASALLCFESDVSCCHRGPLADELSRWCELPISHL